ncbi:hypothetical protein M3Y94_01132800 [Aphelenchoides besseyi]|nr:hypothetical protein M3Y94_01132800 [Aphelenchoides besseyi]KAI6218264.1 hypothetical protein M3Y95_01171600 [Aphelenchoides besseyi]
MRELVVCILFLVVRFPVVTSSVNYEITLNEKTELLNTCIGDTGHVSLNPSYLVFLIDVKERRCLEILRNSVINTIFNESPTRFDIYVPQENEKPLSCSSTFTLTEIASDKTLLSAQCL